MKYMDLLTISDLMLALSDLLDNRLEYLYQSPSGCRYEPELKSRLKKIRKLKCLKDNDSRAEKIRKTSTPS